MENDIVTLNVTGTETNGVSLFKAEIGQKPLFMLDEEYVQQIIGCATEGLRVACNAVYPDDVEYREKLAKVIAERAVKDDL